MSEPVAERFHGAWRLVSAVSDGIICYDPSGLMSVQTATRKPRPRAGEKATAAEALAALDGYIAYFGTWTIDEQARTVTHHQVGTVQPGGNSALVRAYEFVAPDRLILRPVGRTGEIVWQRIGVRPSGSDT